MRLTLIITALLLVLPACKSDHHDHERGEAHAAMCSASLTAVEYGDSEVVEQPGAKIGDLTRCPISSSVFRVTESSPHVEQKGQTYYTCCGGCVDQLEKSFARRR